MRAIGAAASMSAEAGLILLRGKRMGNLEAIGDAVTGDLVGRAVEPARRSGRRPHP